MQTTTGQKRIQIKNHVTTQDVYKGSLFTRKPFLWVITWVYQKVPRLSSTDRKQMALGEYLRYD